MNQVGASVDTHASACKFLPKARVTAVQPRCTRAVNLTDLQAAGPAVNLARTKIRQSDPSLAVPVYSQSPRPSSAGWATQRVSPRRPPRISPRSHRSPRNAATTHRSPRNATAEEQDPFAQNYRQVGPIGQGAFSQVHSAMHRLHKKLVAVKSWKRKSTDSTLITAMQNEIAVLQTLREQPQPHPHIVHIIETLNSPRHTHMVMEHCGGGSLHAFLKGYRHQADSFVRQAMTEGDALRLLAPVADAVNHFHGLGIAHRDLKPANLLFSDASHACLKVADFGCGVHMHGKMLTMSCGTPSYMAPEVHKGMRYNGCLSDVWSLGCVLYEMMHGSCAFVGTTSGDALSLKIQNCHHEPFGHHVSKHGRGILKRMLALDPKNRMAHISWT